ncbi:protein JTB [Tachyglossus aculeatus]|uniref:protein JTB n=1 Tax=Tachyglossus aculeatus TaxID=9261 RepID=UPI0018F77F55|nr:protein JTB [Tachyglossus aculeatus]
MLREPGPARGRRRAAPGLSRDLLLLGGLLCACAVDLGCTDAPVKDPEKPAATAAPPCWLVEEFAVVEPCGECTSFQAKMVPECSTTGFVEKVSCSASKKETLKSCRSAHMEHRAFWRFEAAALGLAGVFAGLVLCRQRLLDRRALEKVRKQIESI